MTHNFKQAKDYIYEHKAHILRSVYTEDVRQNILRNLQSGEALVTCDYAQKWNPQGYLEKQSE